MPPLMTLGCHCKEHSGTQYISTFFLLFLYWPQLIFKEASGKKTGWVVVTETLLHLGHHETGQIICSHGNLELLLGIQKIEMKKLENHKSDK